MSYYLSINDPCHEARDKMSPNEQGRFCASCAKTVVDFTLMSDEEITAFIDKSKGRSLCGNFKASQLDRWMAETQIKHTRPSIFKYLLSLALITSAGTALGQSRTESTLKPVAEQTTKDTLKPRFAIRDGSSHFVEPLIVLDGDVFKGDIRKIPPQRIVSLNVLKGPAATALYGISAGAGAIIIQTSLSEEERKALFKASVAPDVISGKVVDSADGQPIPYATIILEGTDVRTSCDWQGNFTLSVPSSTKAPIITVSTTLGYATSSFAYAKGNYPTTFYLKRGGRLEDVLAGGVTVVRYKPKKWYQFWKKKHHFSPPPQKKACTNDDAPPAL